MKQFLKKQLPSLAYFYQHLRYRLIVLLVVSILVGLMDGLGLAMFLPLLELVADQDTQATSEQMGNLAFILLGLQSLGLQLTLTVVLLTMLAFFILKGIAKYASAYLNVVYQQFFTKKIRIENIEALSNYSYTAFVSADAGAIQNTLSGEVQRIVLAFARYMQILQQAVLVLTYSILAFLANPEFTVLIIIGGGLSNFLFSVLYKKTKALSRQLVQSNHGFQGLLIQQVAFFKYLKATNLIEKYAANLKNQVNLIEIQVKKIGIINGAIQAVREPMMMAIVVATILLQVYILGGGLSTIILSLLFFYRGLGAIMSLQTSYNQFLSYSGSLDNMTEFVNDLKSHKEQNGEKLIEAFSEKIELKHLNFSYQPNDLILEDINLTLHRNEILALVGESGSGKTTLMNIFSGLLVPVQGEMLIDGIDSRTLNMHSLQKRIGYITQEAVIFDDTIFNNVTFWAEKNVANLRRFWDTLEKASIAEFVSSQPEAENARLGNNGINLSGGQKQRISIARELYKEVDFLFMDEATSALDSETEQSIQASIDLLKGNYTILIIAHRLSTIRNADRVAVFKKGKIEHLGTYKDLAEQSVSFKRMLELQEL